MFGINFNSQPISNVNNPTSIPKPITQEQNLVITNQPLKNDSFTANPLLTANNNNNPTTDDVGNLQAGFFKKMFNSIGNAFGKMADVVGLGTISHYAKQNFQMYDANKTNSLDTNEFSAVSQMIGKSFQEVDSNANQEVSLGEFKKIVGDIVDSNFKALDTSDDGFLNYNEAASGGYVVANGSNNSFASHDVNQDNLLSRNEFAGLVNDMKLKKNQ